MDLFSTTSNSSERVDVSFVSFAIPLLFDDAEKPLLFSISHELVNVCKLSLNVHEFPVSGHKDSCKTDDVS